MKKHVSNFSLFLMVIGLIAFSHSLTAQIEDLQVGTTTRKMLVFKLVTVTGVFNINY